MTDWLRTAWNTRTQTRNQAKRERLRSDRRRTLQRHVESLEDRRLLAADSGMVSIEETRQLAEHATGLWESAGISSDQLAALQDLDYQVADLGGNKLALYQPGQITIDDNAAGNLWFVDQTPLVNEEFLELDGTLIADTATLADAKIDLLTALLHEQGHALGLDGVVVTGGNVMSEALGAGIRRLPIDGQADGSIAGSLTDEEFLTSNPSGGGQDFNNLQPYATTNYVIALQGDFPSRNLGGQPLLGGVQMIAATFAPRGYALAHGQVLPINQYQSLYSILGTTYGGDGVDNFALPDLRGRVPVGVGQGPELENYTLGQKGGIERVSLTENQLAGHSHTVAGLDNTGATGDAQFDNRQPFLVMTPVVSAAGDFPDLDLASDPLLGSVSWFAGNFVPRGFSQANGAILPISQNTALFSILGTTYGGDGRTTFGLPDLRGRTPIHAGNGPGLSPVRLGEKGGTEYVTLSESQLPSHNHLVDGLTNPTGRVGASQSIENHMPYLALNYNISLFGVFPSRSLDAGGSDDSANEDTEGVGFISGTTQLEESAALPLIEALFAEGIERWEAAGITSEQVVALESVELRLRDLAPGRLAAADAGLITLDRDASGRGWFVDATPGDDMEFGDVDPRTGEWVGTTDESYRHYDLLTAIMHEQGHLLGIEHTFLPGGLMYGGLSVGSRVDPDATLLANLGSEHSDADHEEVTSYLDVTPAYAEVGMFAGNFNPRGWALTDGQLLAISSNDALFSLVGTTYGGDGRTTFGLPDFRGRVVMGEGQGPGLSNFRLGQKSGTQTNTLNITQIPSHTHPITLPAELDFGDAPASYGEVFHVGLGAHLGPARDIEASTFFTADADGDDNHVTDDEDGVTFPSTLVQGQQATILVELQDPGATNLLDAWIDFDQNGLFEASEEIASGRDLGPTAGTKSLSFDIPTGASVGDTFARFRLSSAGTSGPTGVAVDGEVEDYKIAIAADVGPLTIDLPAGSGTSILTRDGNEFVITRGGVEIARVDASNATSLVINGNDADDDTLQIDFASGNPILGIPTTFNGGAGGNDAITLLNAPNLPAAFTFDNVNDGNITQGDLNLTYTGLEPISFGGTFSDVILTFNGGMETIDITDETPGDGVIRVNSSAGELLDMSVPSGSLTINAGSGDDTIVLSSLDAAWNADLIIDGEADADTFRPTGTIKLGTGNLTISTETIDLLTGVWTLQTDGGDVWLNGTVDHMSDISIDTEDGDNGDAGSVTITGNVSGSTQHQFFIDTSTGGGVGGDVSLQQVEAGIVIVDATGSATDGIVSLNGDITSTRDFSADTFQIAGDVQLGASVTLTSNSFFVNPGAVDLGDATISASAAGFDLIVTANSLTTGPGVVTLGSFSNNGGDFVRAVNVTASAQTDPPNVPGTILITGNVGPGPGVPGILTATAGNVVFADNSSFAVDIGGATAGSGAGFHDQINAAGSVSIGTGVTLSAVDFGGFGATLTGGETIEIINRDGGFGTFAGLPEGATLPNFLGSGLNGTISYAGGDGDDVVVLTSAPVETEITLVGDTLTVVDVNGGTSDDNLQVFLLGTTYQFTEVNGNIIDASSIPGSTGSGTTSVTVPAAGVTGLDVRTLGGDDMLLWINAAAADYSVGGVMIDGGTGSDSMSFSGALPVNMGNADLTVTATRQASVSGAGPFSFVNGNLTVEGNASGTFAGSTAGTAAALGATVNVTGTGNVTVTGRGGQLGGAGVLFQGRVSMTGTGPTAGTVTIDGQAGGGASGSRGVTLTDSNAFITSVDGNIMITGVGTDGGSSNYGIEIDDIDRIESTGTGADAATITLNGTAGNGVFDNAGLRISSGNIISAEGDISLTGAGGTADPTSVASAGVSVLRSTVQIDAGNLLIDGISNGGAAAGVRLFEGEIRSIGDGVVEIIAEASGTSTGSGMKVENIDNVIGGSLSTGNVTINADSIEWENLTVQSTGDLVIQPRTPGTTIGLGGGTGDLNLDDTELGFLVDGFNSITIGDTAAGTGTVDIDTVTFTDPITIAGGTINDNAGTDIDAGTNSVTLDGNVSPGQSPGVLTVTGNFTFADNDTYTFEFDGTAAGTGPGFHDQIDVTGTVTIGTNVAFVSTTTGANTPSAGDELIIIRNDGADAVTGSFSGLAEGATIADFLGSGLPASISYVGGDGNDVVLTVGGAVSVAVSPDSVFEDGPDNLVYTFTRDNTTGDLTVNFTLSGDAVIDDDYTVSGATMTGNSGTVTIFDGMDTAMVTIDPSVDSTVELDEKVVMTIDAGTGYVLGTPGTAEGTISNDDSATIDVSSPSDFEDAGPLQFVVTFSNPIDVSVFVDIDLSDGSATLLDNDYQGLVGTITLSSPGDTNPVITVNIPTIADDKVEPNETINLLLSNLFAFGRDVTLGTQGVGTIINDDFDAQIDVNGNLIIDDPDGSQDDAVTIVVDGDNYRLTDPVNGMSAGPGTTQDGPNSILVPITDVTGEIRVTTRGGDDVLNIDHNGGIIQSPIVFHGGDDSDDLVVTGGTFTDGTLDFENPNDGSINLDGSVITYTGLEPIDFTGTDIDNLVLNFVSANSEIITLSDVLAVGDNFSRIDSTEGELLDFATPNVSLTITTNFGTGAGTDAVLVQGLDALFDADLTIRSDGDDFVAFQNAPTDLGSGNADITSGAVVFNSAGLLTTGNATLTALSSAIETAGSNLVDITANELILNAPGFVGTAGGNPLNVQVNALEGVGGSGRFAVWNQGDLTVGGISGIDGVSTTGGDIELYSVSGNLTVDETIDSSGGDIELETGLIFLPTGGDITINASVLSGNGLIEIAADNNVLLTANAVIDSEAGSNVQIGVFGAAPPQISIKADGDGDNVGGVMMADGSLVDAWDGDIFIEASEDISISLLRSSSKVLVGSNLGAILDVDGPGLDVDDRGSGTASAFLLGVAGVGMLADPIETQASQLQADASTGGGDLVIDNQGDVTLIDVLGPLGFPLDFGVRTFGGQVAISSTGHVIVSDEVLSIGGNILLTADSDLVDGGGLTIDDGVQVDAGTGNVNLDATDDVLLTGLIGTMVIVESLSGSILENGDTNPDITAQTAMLTALVDIGAPMAGDLDVDVDNLTATTLLAPNPGMHGIWISDSDDVIASNVTTVDGVIVLRSGGQLTATNVSAGGPGRGASLTTTAGDLIVADVSAMGRVHLQSAAAITDGDAGPDDNDVTAAELTLQSGSFIAAGSNFLDTSVAALSATTGPNVDDGVWVSNTGDLTISDLPALAAPFPAGSGILAGGNIVVTALSPLTVSADTISALGLISLTATDSTTTGDDLTVHSGVTVRADASSVTLRAGDDLLLEDGSTVSGDTVQLMSDFGDADVGVGTVISLLGTIVSTGDIATADAMGSDEDLLILNPGVGQTVDAIKLDGRDGSDEYQIFFGRLIGGVEIDDTIGGMDNATLVATDANETLTIDGANGFVDNTTLGEIVQFSTTLEDLSVEGGLGNDTVNITASGATTIHLDGGDPTNLPGDTLNLDAMNSGLNLNGNVLTVDGMQPISHVNFETFLFANVSEFTIEADGNNNDIRVVINGGNTDVIIDGVTVLSQPTANIPKLTINGNDGNDTFTVDYSNGTPIPPEGLFFNGNGQNASGGDSVVLDNGTVTTIVHTFANQNDGTIDIDGSVITYTGLEPIIDNLDATDRVFTYTGGDETITLSDDGDAGDNQSQIVSTLGESVVFTHPTNSVTVNAGTGADAVIVTTLDALYAASLIVDGGNDASTDLVTLTNVDLINTPGRGLWLQELETVSITGGTISGNTASIGGGLLIDNSTTALTTATLSGVSVTGNTATGGTAPLDGGGGIYNNGGVLNILGGSMISGNMAVTGNASGGGILSTGTLTITGSTITGNDANRAGGGIEIANGSGPTTLTDVTLSLNHALAGPGNGGGLHVSGTGNVEMVRGTVTGNTAASEGGGLWNGGGTMTINGTSITGNTASGNGADNGGGGIFNDSGILDIDNATISDNEADGTSGSGGGIFSLAGTVTIDNTTIESNSANRAGGGIEVVVGTVTLTDVNLLTNDVDGLGTTATAPNPGNGGGLHVTATANVTVAGGLVQGNIASEEGGGLWNSSTGTMIIDDVMIDANIARAADGGTDQGGGGIFNAGGNLTIRNNTIITNNLANEKLGNGGGVMTVGGVVTLDNTTLTGNLAARAGGGIENNGGDVTLTNVTVGGVNAPDGNTAAINGGGLHASGASITIVDGGLFQNNVAAEEGGGLWNGPGTMTIRNNTTLTQNTANSLNNGGNDQGGGGVFNIGGTLDIDNALITKNLATANNGNGGGVMTVGGIVTIDDSSIQSNEATRAGGGIENNDGNVTVTNETVGGPAAAVGNIAGINGGGLHASGANSVTTVNGGLFQNNIAGEEGGGLWNGSGMMTINGTQILNNTASSSANTNNDQGGGGVFNVDGTLSILNATISGNLATANNGNGGGVMTVGGTVTIDDTLIQSNQAARAGGGVENNNGNVTLTGVTLGGPNVADGNTAGINGGGLHASGAGSVTIVDGGSIQNNIAQEEGGGLWNGPGTMTIRNNTTITQNTANSANNGGNDQGGGGVFNIGGTLNIDNASITNNLATSNNGNGGGVMTVGGIVTVNNAFVGSNLTGRDGGGLHASSTSDVTINGGTFQSNTAPQEGGGLWNGEGRLNINGTTITENTADSLDNAGNDQGGGGIFNNGGTLDIADATITGNLATANNGNGGGVMTVGGGVTISGGVIQGNRAARAGGGIENNNGSVSLSGVSVGGPTPTDGNTAGINGGGIHLSGSAVTTIFNGLVQNNIADQEGGGIWNSADGTLTLSGVVVDANLARSTDATNTAQGGGGIFNDGGQLTIRQGVVISNNIALDPDGPASQDDGGGGIFNNGGVVSIADAGTEIRGNLAIDGSGNGGGILNLGGEILIENATVAGNQAARAGGGLETIGGVIVLNAATFGGPNLVDGNSAGINGGGLHVSGQATIHVNDGLFQNNTAAQEGGGLWNSSQGTMTITGTTIRDNTASGPDSDQGGGGIFNAGGVLDVTNASIIANVANGTSGSGGGILNDAFGSLSVTNSTVQSNRANRAGGGIETTPGTTNTLTNVNLDLNNAGQLPAISNPGNGGGLHVTGDADVTITGGTVNGNRASEEGGGLWNGGGTLIVSGTQIDGNRADGTGVDQGGGGVFNSSGVVSLTNVQLSNNVADQGAGAFNDLGTLNVRGSQIAGNNSTGLTYRNIAGILAENNVSGNGGGGVTGLVGTTGNDTILVTSTTISINGATLNYDGTMGPISIQSGDGNDVIEIRSTASGSPITIDAGAGDDLIYISSDAPANGGTLNSINGDITIIGGSQSSTATTTESVTARIAVAGSQTINANALIGDQLFISDSSSSTNNAYTLTSTTFTRSGYGTITFGTVETLDITTGNGDDSINVSDSAIDSQTTLRTGGGDDNVFVATTGDDSILRVATQGGSDSVNIQSTGAFSVLLVDTGNQDDSVSISGRGASSGIDVRTQAGNDVINLGDSVTPATVDTGLPATIFIDGGANNDTFSINEVFAASVVELNGNGGNDSFLLTADGSNANGTLGRLNDAANARQLLIDGGGNGNEIRTFHEGIVVSAAGEKNEPQVRNQQTGDTVVVDASSATTALDLQYLIVGPGEGILSTGTNEVFDSLGVETLRIHSGSGNDSLTIESNIAFGIESSRQAIAFDAGDGENDHLTVVGTDQADRITIGAITGDSTLEPIEVDNVETVTVDGNDGNDQLSNRLPTLANLNGGDGDDIILGGFAVDVLNAGSGENLLFGRLNGEIVPQRGEGEIVFDVNGDGFITAVDPLQVINKLNSQDNQSGEPTSDQDSQTRKYISHLDYADVNADGYVTALDALMIINLLNSLDNSQSAEPNAETLFVLPPSPSDLSTVADEETTSNPFVSTTTASDSMDTKMVSAPVSADQWGQAVDQLFEQEDDASEDSDIPFWELNNDLM
ncbi:tail fiber protein [Aporhodopirellula aestuarii]|uniref:Tail fiber protein n=1 Tax=Aporhodopirellula aestuarii TaxID=2950107 RepID=A0ABT0U3H4_9BACT|nr:tail fiber protein [Aporhodopirellula aestuarii]MCM2371003.1 tail fiber protein [Aporhodopirellula aestuarii]